MRRVPIATAALLATVGLLTAPAQAAPKKVIKTTIPIPGSTPMGIYLTGTTNGVGSASAKQVCPGPGQFDGQTYRFFDLKEASAKVIKAYGPKPALNQDVAGDVYNEYDIDIYGYDAKCVRVVGPTGFTGTSTAGSELFKPKKPVRYLVAAYFQGPYKDLPVTLEIT